MEQIQGQHIFDNHGRPINYLRLSVTDRCNLRCFYCMPEQGINYVKRNELLSYEELEALVLIFSKLGISKIRITGGEPFVRNDLIGFIGKISNYDGISEIAITTNGVLTGKYLKRLKEYGIKNINLSLDSIDKERFRKITRRNEFDRVWDFYREAQDMGFDLKINCVVIDGQNIDDILPMVELTRHDNVDVRFIEEMPFNGDGAHYPILKWTHKKILEHIQSGFDLEKLEDGLHSTSKSYKVKGFTGSFGIIAAFSRTFCGSCNRIRMSATGDLRTCLYGEPVLNLRDMLRSGASGNEIEESLIKAFKSRAKDGFEAEKMAQKEPSESMSVLGG
ncbi:MAG: GTP 3',8-cyclase MoaA [Bacteroidota bacterium]